MTIRSKPPTRAYDEGWERTFGSGSPRGQAEARLNAALKAWGLGADGTMLERMEEQFRREQGVPPAGADAGAVSPGPGE